MPQINKAQEAGVATSTLGVNFFYRPGERAAGPLCMFVEMGSGAAGIQGGIGSDTPQQGFVGTNKIVFKTSQTYTPLQNTAGLQGTVTSGNPVPSAQLTTTAVTKNVRQARSAFVVGSGNNIGTGSSTYTVTLAPMQPLTLTILSAGNGTIVDNGSGGLVGSTTGTVNILTSGTNTVNYITGAITVTYGATANSVNANYMPAKVCAQGIQIVELDQFFSEQFINFQPWTSATGTTPFFCQIVGWWL